MDNRSLSKTEQQIADYADTVWKTRAFAVERNHQQPGDPSKLAQAALQLANAAEPPLRLPLGEDALERIADRNAFVERETGKVADPGRVHRLLAMISRDDDRAMAVRSAISLTME